MKNHQCGVDACGLCAECTGTRSECKQPKSTHPTPEAMGVDLISTVRQVGYPIHVLSDYTKSMSRF